MALSRPPRAGLVHSGASARVLSVLGAGVASIASAEDASAVAQALADSDIVVTWCANGTAAERLLRREGLLWHAPAGLPLIDFSPISPALMKAIAGHCASGGHRVHGAALSCSGGAVRAFVDATVMQDPAALDVVRAIAPEVVATGAPGTSKAMSIVECLLAGVAAAASAEAMAISWGAGIEARALIPLLMKGSGANRALAEQIGTQPTSDVEAMRTGLALARDTARELEHPAVFGALAFATLRGAVMPSWSREPQRARSTELAT